MEQEGMMNGLISGVLMFLVTYRILVAIFVGVYVLTSAILWLAGFEEISLNMMIALLFAIFIPYISYAIFSILGGVA